MTNKAVLIYYIWTSFSPELYAEATAVGFDEENSDHTKRQVLIFVKGRIVSKPPHRKVEAEEALARTPSASPRAKLPTLNKPSSARAPAPNTENLAAQKVKSREALNKNPQAGGVIRRSLHPGVASTQELPPPRSNLHSRVASTQEQLQREQPLQ